MPQSPVILDTPTDAMQIAARRGVLPSALSSAEQQRQWSRGTRDTAVYAARVTNAAFLSQLKLAVDKALAGGTDSDLPLLRRDLRDYLVQLGYTPEKGFPGDEALGIPPAAPGSLTDLLSQARLDLMLETQIRLQRNRALLARALEGERETRYPAFELVRVAERKVPRGSDVGSLTWVRRWLKAGGPWNLAGRLIAHKRDGVWEDLGRSDLFDDAIDAGVPPFAFRSGYGWREVSAAELAALGITLDPQRNTSLKGNATPANVIPFPPAEPPSTEDWDDDVAKELRKRILKERSVESKAKRLGDRLRAAKEALDKKYAA